jgi:excisionase family DNA binding protein
MKQTNHPTQRLLTLDEVAEELGVDRMTVYYRLLSHEQLPGMEVGKQWREKIEDRLMKKENQPQEVNTPPLAIAQRSRQRSIPPISPRRLVRRTS